MFSLLLFANRSGINVWCVWASMLNCFGHPFGIKFCFWVIEFHFLDRNFDHVY